MKRFVLIAWPATVAAALVSSSGPLGGFWATMPISPAPSRPVLAGLIAESMVENLAFGIGIAILLTGYRWFAERTADRVRARTAWLASVWLFASWMPHGSLHRHIGMDALALVPVEWTFHVGAIVAVAALLLSLHRRASVRETAGSGERRALHGAG